MLLDPPESGCSTPGRGSAPRTTFSISYGVRIALKGTVRFERHPNHGQVPRKRRWKHPYPPLTYVHLGHSSLYFSCDGRAGSDDLSNRPCRSNLPGATCLPVRLVFRNSHSSQQAVTFLSLHDIAVLVLAVPATLSNHVRHMLAMQVRLWEKKKRTYRSRP